MENEIPIFVHSHSPSSLNGRIIIGDSMSDVQFIEVQSGFYLYNISYKKIDAEPIYLYLTAKGPTKKVEIDTTKPFLFIDMSEERRIVDFNEFLTFFNIIVSKKILTVSEEKKFDCIPNFVNAFENDYFVWAVLFIAGQGWCSIFDYDEMLSDVMLKLITKFIRNNFFSQNKAKCDFKKYSPNGIQFSLYQDEAVSFKSSQHYMRQLIMFLNSQIGQQLTYLFLSCLDFDLYVLPLNSKMKRIYSDVFNNILIDLIDLSKDFNDYMKIFTTFLSSCNSEDDLILTKIIDVANIEIDPVIASDIIRKRLFKSKPKNENDLEFIFKQLPNLEKILEIFCDDFSFIPFEWIPHIKNASGIDNQLLFTLIANNSLKYSISKHLYSSFSRVTNDGELISDDNLNCEKDINQQDEKTNVVFNDKQIIIKNNVIIGDNVLILKNTHIGKNTKIGSNCVIGQNARIHTGVIINNDEFITHDIEIPIGFRYNTKIIEFSNEIPKIITKELYGFSKQKSGFIDLELLLNTYPCFLIEFFESLSSYPYECGKQFGKNYDKINEIECFQEQFLHIFKQNTLLFVIGYWEEMQKNRSKIHEPFFKALCRTMLIDFIENEKPETLNDIKASELILNVTTHINLIAEHVRDKGLIKKFEKAVFELCDEASVHLSLVKNESTEYILRNLHSAIQIIHPK